MNNLTPAQVDYLNWIKRNMPLFYADVVQPYLGNAALGSIGADDTNVFSQILDSVTNALPSLSTAYSQYVGAQAMLENQTAQQQLQLMQQTRTGSTNWMPWILAGGIGLIALIALR